MSTSPLFLTRAIVDVTLAFLRECGRRNSEGVVLWLGQRESQGLIVAEAYVPEQIAARDFFKIPSSSMTDLVTHLGKTDTIVAAQVHSHPRLAFHSLADDEWAIVRHLGALSLVVPFFAATTNVDNFVNQTVVFCLNAANEWIEVPENRWREMVHIK